MRLALVKTLKSNQGGMESLPNVTWHHNTMEVINFSGTKSRFPLPALLDTALRLVPHWLLCSGPLARRENTCKHRHLGESLIGNHAGNHHGRLTHRLLGHCLARLRLFVSAFTSSMRGTHPLKLASLGKRKHSFMLVSSTHLSHKHTTVPVHWAGGLDSLLGIPSSLDATWYNYTRNPKVP